MGQTPSKRERERQQMIKDLKTTKDSLAELTGQLQRTNNGLAEDVRELKQDREITQQKLTEEKESKQRWTNFAVDLQKKYNNQAITVQKLIKKNKQLQEQVDTERHLSLLERVQLAVDSDPMFEDEIRNIIDDTPAIKKDFQRVFLVDADGPCLFEAESGPGRTESNEFRMVESDCMTESDGCRPGACSASPFTEDDGYESPDDDAVQSGVAIAYVLSKMYNKI